MKFEMKIGERIEKRKLIEDIVEKKYKRKDIKLVSGYLRVRGEKIEILNEKMEEREWRIQMLGDEIEKIKELDKMKGKKKGEMKQVKI